MKWHRKITSCLFKKEDAQWDEPTEPRIFCQGEWGRLIDFNAKGQGWVRFENGSGQIIRNWAHFLRIAEIIETEDNQEKDE